MRNWPLTLWAISSLLAATAVARAGSAEFFERKIRPVLADNCYECHSASSKKLRAELRVDSRAALLQGGETGPALTPGQPKESLLYQAITHEKRDGAMPPKKPKLPDSVLADFEKWIQDGAFWPEEAAPAPVAQSEGFDLDGRVERLPWIWTSPQRPPLPPVKDPQWAATPIDHFILHRLESEGLRPSEPAEPEVWLRRVSFALIGLPPTPPELRAFLQDPSPQARAHAVDRLLASPHFGERWGRHWLDLVRYAESRGHEGDYIIPNAFEYRDYIVRALNQDLPYDTFVKEHLAGDLIRPPRLHPQRGFNESILGTGWAFLGEEIHAPVDTRLDETERIDNRVDVMTKTFLGVTVSCARCHDHKFDAITQRDYYALAGFFISSGQRLVRFETMEQETEIARELDALEKHWAPQILETIRETFRPLTAQISDYLLAASEAALTAKEPIPDPGKPLSPNDFSESLKTVIHSVATQRQLSSARLQHWTAALLKAARDTHAPLHVFAARALEPDRPSSTPPPSPALSGSVGPNLPPGARVIVDYAGSPASAWLPDGVAFGLKPVAAGELTIWPPAAGHPLRLRLASRPAAQTDWDWQGLDLSPGVEREPTMFGGWKRDGLMIRTPKFELTSGKLHYLVRGSGRIVAAVDSQRLITGPLHTSLVRSWEFQDRWHWVSQNLSDYPGHRLAIEFSPGNDFDSSIALVIESEEPPPAPASWARLIQPRLPTAPTAGASDLAALAEAYERCFETALSSASNSQNPSDPGELEIARWLLDRPALFTGNESRWPAPVQELADSYLAARAPVIARVQWKSKTAPAMMEANGVDEYLLVRGKHHTPKGLVPRRFLEAVSGSEPIPCDGGSGRLALAEIMTAPSNPLLARVLVNRAWHHLFGRGIVASVDNFGWLGQRPTHPELLDFLAHSFIHEDGWSLKKLIRRMVLTRVYAQSSRASSAEAEERDPENLLLHRMNMQRLQAEAIRDAILAVSGRLDRSMYGPGVPLHPSQFIEARGLRGERGPLDGHGRRSLYVAARRNFLPMMMTAFDTPTPFTTVGRRNVSNVPGQMLFLMNDPFVHQQAEVWARHLQTALPAAAPETRVRRLYEQAFSREPSPAELDRCLLALKNANAIASAGTDPWTELCHALFGVKEFIYIR